VIGVSHGKESFDVCLPRNSSVLELKTLIQAQTGVAPVHQKLLIKGKFRANDALLEDCGVKTKSCRIKLLFSEGFHIVANGETRLKQVQEELEKATATYAKLEKQIKHRFIDSVDVSLTVNHSIDTLENMVRGLDDAPVKQELVEDRDRVIVEITMLVEKLRSMRNDGF